MTGREEATGAREVAEIIVADLVLSSRRKGFRDGRGRGLGEARVRIERLVMMIAPGSFVCDTRWSGGQCAREGGVSRPKPYVRSGGRRRDQWLTASLGEAGVQRAARAADADKHSRASLLSKANDSPRSSHHLTM